MLRCLNFASRRYASTSALFRVSLPRNQIAHTPNFKLFSSEHKFSESKHKEFIDRLILSAQESVKT